MGTTSTETRTEKRNYPTFPVNKFYTFAYCFFSAIIALGIYAPIAEQKAVNNTLKLCNEKQSECKFKYDILMYTETGRVPNPIHKSITLTDK